MSTSRGTEHSARSASRPDGVRRFIRALVADFQEGDLLTYASAIAFRVLFAVIPFALFAAALLGFLGLQDVWTRQVAPAVHAGVGDQLFAVLNGAVVRVLSARRAFWLTLGLGLAVWELSSAVRATAGALNRIYRQDDGRSFVRWIGETVLLAVAVGSSLLAAAFAIYFGPAVARWLLGPSDLADVIGFVARWALALGGMVLAFALLLRYAPGDRIDWRGVGSGALVTVAVWSLASVAFDAYVTGVVSYGSVFGGLAIPFVALTYLYVAALAFLFGVWFERRRRARVDRPVRTPPDAEGA